jgi:DNA-binding MurR/RpiR family transcriptional regulator
LIAITANQSPLARKADVALVAEHNGKRFNTFAHMVSRVLALVVDRYFDCRFGNALRLVVWQ